MRTKKPRFDAEQYELDFAARIEGPRELVMGEVVEIHGKRYRVQALRPKVVTLWRLPAADEDFDVPF
jgi:hypothetical protein